MQMKEYEFWFVVGSQFLYGPEVLEIVASRAKEMADTMNKSGILPCKVVYKVTAKSRTSSKKRIIRTSAPDLSPGCTLSRRLKCGLTGFQNYKSPIAILPRNITAKFRTMKSTWIS